MEIYKGERYQITTDGLTATKIGENCRLAMKYYPERDISALRGEIDEQTAWRIFLDVARQSQSLKTPVSPEHILIDGSGFILSEWSGSVDSRFTAPEGYEKVWALAATVFYVFLGCHVFQGLGGRGETATTPIPILRKELQNLSSLIVRCLDFDPVKRPDMQEIIEISEQNIKRCEEQAETQPLLKTKDNQTITYDEIETYWPEEMCLPPAHDANINPIGVRNADNGTK